MTIDEILTAWHERDLFVQVFNSPRGSIRHGGPAWTCNVVGAGITSDGNKKFLRGEGASSDEAIRAAWDSELPPAPSLMTTAIVV